MDVMLEMFDTVIADHVYSYSFPIACPNEIGDNNSTQTVETWEWQPASKLFHLQPSQAYMSSLARNNPYRQSFSLFFITWLLGVNIHLSFATLLYHLTFDKRYRNHPKFMPGQIWLEIKTSIRSLAIFSIIITPLILLEVRGYSKLYDTTADGPGWWYNILQIPLFLLFADFCSYWIHRLSHHPRVYSHFLYGHKLHHRFIIPTPYASQATHPMEGIVQSLPHYIFTYILPLQKMVHIGLFIILIFWNTCNHDGHFLANNSILNGAASHSMHHKYHNCNYGLYFTIFDRLHGTYRQPGNWKFQEQRCLDEIEWTHKSQRVKRNKSKDETFKTISIREKYE